MFFVLRLYRLVFKESLLDGVLDSGGASSEDALFGSAGVRVSFLTAGVLLRHWRHPTTNLRYLTSLVYSFLCPPGGEDRPSLRLPVSQLQTFCIVEDPSFRALVCTPLPRFAVVLPLRLAG